jgi:hypothetical protein
MKDLWWLKSAIQSAKRTAARLGLATLSVVTLAAALWWTAQSALSPASGALARGASESVSAEAVLAGKLGNLGLWFEPNHGQAADDVAFQSKGYGYDIRLDREAGAKLTLSKYNSLRMDLVAGSPRPLVVGVEELAGVSNYLIGSDPDAWRTGVPHYGRVRYQDVYPGIDLEFYGNRGQLEYDFVVAPGSDPSRIRLAFSGAEEVTIAANGDLQLRVAGGEVVHRAPVAYQEVPGGRRVVDGAFDLLMRGNAIATVGFELSDYDYSRPLIIDPKIDYSTYLGGTAAEIANGVTVDSSGNLYVTGITWSSDFPTASPIDSIHEGATDAFIIKLSPDGSTLLYSTFLGGSQTEQGYDIAVDPSGRIYVTGETASTDFPTLNAYQPTFHGMFFDAFVTKLNSTGSAFVFSTYLGGSGDDHGSGIDVDIHGNSYVAGKTYASDFPTESAFQPTNGGGFGMDGFVTKFNDDGTVVWFSSYIGGSDKDSAADIALDTLYQAYVVGITESSDFPTVNATQKTRAGLYDTFVAKLSESGGLSFSTYHGGTGDDSAVSVDVDSSGRPYVAGWTESTNFPTVAAWQPTRGGAKDALVAKFHPSGSVTYATYFGGSGDEQVQGLVVDPMNRAHVVGWTTSTNYPLFNPVQPLAGGATDAFVFVLRDAGAGLVHSSYLGGSANDFGQGAATDAGGNTYVVGYTYATDFPIHGALQPTNAGERDLFLVKIDNSSLDFFVVGVPWRLFQRRGVPADR